MGYHGHHWFPIVFFSGVAALAIACGGGGGAQTASSSGELKVNLEEIFPPGPGRDLVLENCQNCHTFVPIVVLQMDKDAWQRNSLDHRERVTTLTDEQFKTLYEYLSTNFGPHRPVPKLPKELLKTWTGY
jgi:mono/diheme cytochrome c family protein